VWEDAMLLLFSSALFTNNRWLARQSGNPSMFVPLYPYTSS
jgi:hypothetical protein